MGNTTKAKIRGDEAAEQAAEDLSKSAEFAPLRQEWCEATQHVTLCRQRCKNTPLHMEAFARREAVRVQIEEFIAPLKARVSKKFSDSLTWSAYFFD